MCFYNSRSVPAKMEYCSKSHGTVFQLIWNRIPVNLEQQYQMLGPQRVPWKRCLILCQTHSEHIKILYEFGTRETLYANYCYAVVGEIAICFLSNFAQKASSLILNSRKDIRRLTINHEWKNGETLRWTLMVVCLTRNLILSIATPYIYKVCIYTLWLTSRRVDK